MSKSSSEQPSKTDNSSVLATGPPVIEKLASGSTILVGVHKVEVIEYIAEGGFAHIYKVKFIEYSNELDRRDRVLRRGDIACLKRVIVSDENGLNELRTEVEVMKKLKGCNNVVQYYDSNATRQADGSPRFEVLLLMELCPNGSLLDYMNRRLATKLTEGEVLKIMHDIAMGLSQMHYLRAPLIHRDIKIENVLVDANNNFKLCDFGSTSACLPVVSSHQEIAVLTNKIYIHTTPQYRSPEMIDLYRCLPINEKSDIWALGIFLYKLLFYTTPFELTGQFAILHSKYDIPQNNFSSKLINLMIVMLAENPHLRPNIYQVMFHICSMLNCEVPIEDIYGHGPYDFDKYARYQERLQHLQYEMLVTQQNVGYGDNINKLINLFVENFEIAPRQPINPGQGTQSNIVPQPPQSSLPGYSSTQQHGQRVGTLPKPVPSNIYKGNPQQPSSMASGIKNKTANEYEINLGRKNANGTAGEDNFFPVHPDTPKKADLTKERLHMMAKGDNGQITAHSDISDKSLAPTNTRNSAHITTSVTVPMANQGASGQKSVKQYKSNNPFPKMDKDEFNADIFNSNPMEDPFFRGNRTSQLPNKIPDIRVHQLPTVNPKPPVSSVPLPPPIINMAMQQPNLPMSNISAQQFLDLQGDPKTLSQASYQSYYHNNNMNGNQNMGFPVYPYHMDPRYLDPPSAVMANQNIASASYASPETPSDSEPPLLTLSTSEKAADIGLDLTYNQVNLSRNGSLSGNDDREETGSDNQSIVLTSESITLDLSHKDEQLAGSTVQHHRSSSLQNTLQSSKHDEEHVLPSVRNTRPSLDLNFQEIDLSSSSSPTQYNVPFSKHQNHQYINNNQNNANASVSDNAGSHKQSTSGKKSTTDSELIKTSKRELSSSPPRRRSIFGVFKT
ncbi:HGR026Cp [Eremothecium sinecaudum]|uniref:HGR026Cp n=1 Tax=Eremothecium sinecaudum TaxID=45286 RepID=A0A120K2R4_9SACH|nr:HGR026Cp [Eremothecium sinecaudum]AMD22365.1 HGR026Cp [Eremothecium sinecaudum]